MKYIFYILVGPLVLALLAYQVFLICLRWFLTGKRPYGVQFFGDDYFKWFK